MILHTQYTLLYRSCIQRLFLTGLVSIGRQLSALSNGVRIKFWKGSKRKLYCWYKSMADNWWPTLLWLATKAKEIAGRLGVSRTIDGRILKVQMYGSINGRLALM